MSTINLRLGVYRLGGGCQLHVNKQKGGGALLTVQTPDGTYDLPVDEFGTVVQPEPPAQPKGYTGVSNAVPLPADDDDDS